MTRYLIPFFHRDMDEIRAYMKKNDPLFNSLLVEKDHISKLLDAYAGSLIYLSDKNQPINLTISDTTLEDIFGVDGQLQYKNQHSTAVKNILDTLFTSNHKIWISYSQDDPLWIGERDNSIRIIRKNLVEDFIPRLVSIIKNCKCSELQAQEV